MLVKHRSRRHAEFAREPTRCLFQTGAADAVEQRSPNEALLLVHMRATLQFPFGNGLIRYRD